MIKMKTVRKKMLARDLKGLIDLPDYDDAQPVEVAVTPDETQDKKLLSEAEIAAIWERLAGCLAGIDKSKTLDDWRKERLEEKYGIKFAD